MFEQYRKIVSITILRANNVPEFVRCSKIRAESQIQKTSLFWLDFLRTLPKHSEKAILGFIPSFITLTSTLLRLKRQFGLIVAEAKFQTITPNCSSGKKQ